MSSWLVSIYSYLSYPKLIYAITIVCYVLSDIENVGIADVLVIFNSVKAWQG